MLNNTCSAKSLVRCRSDLGTVHAITDGPAFPSILTTRPCPDGINPGHGVINNFGPDANPSGVAPALFEYLFNLDKPSNQGKW